MRAKKIPRYVFRIVGIKQEKEGGKRQKPKGASKTIKTQSNYCFRNPDRQNQIMMTYLAAESSLWRIRFMQGSCCWSENKLDQNPTGKRSIFTRPLRVKKALAFLHSVFSKSFQARRSNFSAPTRWGDRGDKVTW
jgi:hypothetical protein